MLPYLPESALFRDSIIMASGAAFFAALAFLLDGLGLQEWIVVAVCLSGGGYFLYDYKWRWLWAGMKYREAKRKAKR
jgi:hypothetical protein